MVDQEAIVIAYFGIEDAVLVKLRYPSDVHSIMHKNIARCIAKLYKSLNWSRSTSFKYFTENLLRTIQPRLPILARNLAGKYNMDLLLAVFMLKKVQHSYLGSFSCCCQEIYSLV